MQCIAGTKASRLVSLVAGLMLGACGVGSVSDAGINSPPGADDADPIGGDTDRCEPVVEICGDDIDQDCNGGDLACGACAGEAITTRCWCGGAVRAAGFCCDALWQANACDTPCVPTAEICGDGSDQDCAGGDAPCPPCGEGSITSARCVCGDAIHSTGACCADVWQSGSCSVLCPDGDGDSHADDTCGGADCNDANPDIHPGATDLCGDGTDQNCVGGDPTCLPCGQGSIAARCVCGGSVYATGSCCTGIWQATACSGSGQTYLGLTIPTTHPRIWYDATTLAAARTWYTTHTFPLDGSPGDDGYWQIHNATHALLTSSSSECRTSITWALSASAGMDMNGVTCDECRWFGEAIPVIYDWCYDHMTPAERSSLITSTNTWIEHWRLESWGGPEMIENNYYWGYLRNQLLWGIASYHENTTAAQTFIDDALTTRLEDHFYDRVTYSQLIGGVGREGTQYGRYIFGYASMPFATATLAGRDLFTETPFWVEGVYAFIYMTPPAPSTWIPSSGASAQSGYTQFSYSEDEGWLGASPIGFNTGNFMSAAATRWPSAAAGQHARQWLNMIETPISWGTNLRSNFVRSTDPGGTARAFTDLPLDWYAPGVGFFIVRDVWGASSTIAHLDLKDGPNEGHANSDWGAWQIWRNGRFVSRETPAYGETIAGWHGIGTAQGNGPQGHNSLLINGAGNRNGVNGWYVQNVAQVTRLETAPAFAFASVNLTPLNQDPAWQVWVRDFVWVRSMATLVVFDRVQSTAANDTKTFLMHCETDPTIGTGTATCTTGSQSLVMTTLVPATSAYGVVDEGGTIGQYRIEADTTPGTAASHILTVLQAKDSEGANLSPSVVDDGGSYTVSLNGSNSITFVKGMTSSGGSITVGGTSASLRANVQAISVTEAGPVWE